MGPNTRTTEWSLADDDFDTAMGPATTHEIENGDVQLDDDGRAAKMATGKAFEETRGAKMESTRDRQVKVLRSYPLVFAVSFPLCCSCRLLSSCPVPVDVPHPGQLARSLCRALGATLVTGIWTSICSTFRDPGRGDWVPCLFRFILVSLHWSSLSSRCRFPPLSGPGIELYAT